MAAQSPLTGNVVATPLLRYPTEQLIADWKDTFGVDITDQFNGAKEIEKYQCRETGLFFFKPDTTEGTPQLYEALSNNSWYYSSSKWEYKECLAALPPKQKVLDVGCGSGQFIHLALAEGHSASGIETSLSACETAWESKLEVQHEDLWQHAQQNQDTYDCVCSFQVLEHIHDPMRFLKAALKALKPGGLLMLGTPNSESYLRYQYTLLDMPPHHMLQWNTTAYSFLPKLLPLNLESISTEHLASEHIDQYTGTIAKRLIPKSPQLSKACAKLLSMFFKTTQSLGSTRLAKGQGMLAIFSKTDIEPEQQSAKADRSPKYANIGCGSTWHQDWDNYDLAPQSKEVSPLDITNEWSLATRSYDAIYSSHVLEHLSRPEAQDFLVNCYNTLKPGGLLRIVVPDIEGICREYLNQIDAIRAGDTSAKRKHQWMLLELLDQIVRTRSGGAMGQVWASGDLPEDAYIEERVGEEHSKIRSQLEVQRKSQSSLASYEDIFSSLKEPTGERATTFRESGEIHKWMYDELSLSSLLAHIGFEAISKVGGDESSIPNFSSYQLDTNSSCALRKPDSLIIECRRPDTHL